MLLNNHLLTVNAWKPYNVSMVNTVVTFV